MSDLRTYRFMLSGGGTGGHLFPAIAIANRLKQTYPGSEFLFVGAKGRMEMEKVPENGYSIKGLWISGLQRNQLWKNILLPFKIISSLYTSAKLLRKFKPDIVIGTGGYASFALIYMASRKKIPALIQEQNFFPGITNKYLSKYVHIVCTVYEGMEKYFPSEKIRVCGNPVRDSISRATMDRSSARKVFNLSDTKKTVLIIGGSLGAGTLNKAIEKNIDALIKNDIQVIWQCGKYYYNDLKSRVQAHPNVYLNAFINQMDAAYKAADVVVSRAGAISISELAIMGKSCVLVPSPNVAEDHQTKNALALVEKNAALLVKDSEADQKLVDQIIELLNDEKSKTELEKNIAAFAEKDACEKIVKEIDQIIKK